MFDENLREVWAKIEMADKICEAKGMLRRRQVLDSSREEKRRVSPMLSVGGDVLYVIIMNCVSRFSNFHPYVCSVANCGISGNIFLTLLLTCASLSFEEAFSRGMLS